MAVLRVAANEAAPQAATITWLGARGGKQAVQARRYQVVPAPGQLRHGHCAIGAPCH